MGCKQWIFICLFAWMTLPLYGEKNFIPTRAELKPFSRDESVILIASTGRSGSTMLTKTIEKYASDYQIFKTHLLPPDKNFSGKVLFVFSNPDKASESALHMCLRHKRFAKNHFIHVETADRPWAQRLGGAEHQTEQDNLLSYDALGIYKHLKVWLFTKTAPSSPKNAQILAIKYENLWDPETVQAIKTFLI